jgi:hypothetical protein
MMPGSLNLTKYVAATYQDTGSAVEMPQQQTKGSEPDDDQVWLPVAADFLGDRMAAGGPEVRTATASPLSDLG